MFFNLRRKLVALLVISMVFTSNAFCVFADGVETATEQSMTTTIEASENEGGNYANSDEGASEDVESDAGSAGASSTNPDEGASSEIPNVGAKLREPAVEEETTKNFVATNSEASEGEVEEPSINPADVEEPEEDPTTTPVGANADSVGANDDSVGANFRSPHEIIASAEAATTSDLEKNDREYAIELETVKATESETSRLFGAPASGECAIAFKDSLVILNYSSLQAEKDALVTTIQNEDGIVGFHVFNDQNEVGANKYDWGTTYHSNDITRDEAVNRVNDWWNGISTDGVYLLALYDQSRIYRINMHTNVVPPAGYSEQIFERQYFLVNAAGTAFVGDHILKPERGYIARSNISVFAYTPYYVSEWNTMPDGSGTTYNYYDSIDFAAGVTDLYAQSWTLCTYETIFNIYSAKTNYYTNETFDESTVRAIAYFIPESQGVCNSVLDYDASAASDWEFTPPLGTPFTLADSGSTQHIKYLGTTKSDGSDIEWDLTITVTDPPAPPPPAPPAPTPTPYNPGGGDTGGGGSSSNPPAYDANGNLIPGNGLNGLDSSQAYMNVRDSSGHLGYGRWLRIPNTTTWYFEIQAAGNLPTDKIIKNQVLTIPLIQYQSNGIVDGQYNLTQNNQQATVNLLIDGWYNLGWKGQEEWYHFDKNGVMQLGWFSENNKTYYLEEDFLSNWYGRMLTGKRIINGKEYNFDKDGSLLL